MLLWFKTDKYIGDEGARMKSKSLKINSALAKLNMSSVHDPVVCRMKKRNKESKEIIEEGKKEDKMR